MVDTASLEAIGTAVEQHLDALLPRDSEIAQDVVDAMRYTCLGGGKRLRPSLVCATALALGGSLQTALGPAVAVEFLHAYSLIHDDLPAMDDDDLRRGQPTCHVAFGEATAILAGDALQALAFETLATAPDLDPATRVEMVQRLARGAGWAGMVGGQAFDLASEGADVTLHTDELRALHAAKTGALFTVAVQLGGLVAATDNPTFERLTRFGNTIGLAFQVVDDVLDVTQTSEVLGKDAGSDLKANKSTYPVLMGLDGARAHAETLLTDAKSLLAELGIEDGALVDIANAMVRRIM